MDNLIAAWGGPAPEIVAVLGLALISGVLVVLAWLRGRRAASTPVLTVAAPPPTTPDAIAARYRAIVEQTAEGFFLADPRTKRVVEANPAFRALLGYSGPEIALLSAYDFVVLEPLGIDRLYSHLLAERRSLVGDRQYRRKDGGLVDVEVTLNVIALGGQDFICGIVHDITERKRTQAMITQQLDRLAALRSIDQTITASLDLRVTLNVILEHVLSQLHADAAGILLLHPELQTLDHVAGRGPRRAEIVRQGIRLGEGLPGRAALTRRTVSVPDLAALPPDTPRPVGAGAGFASYYAVPLLAKGQVKGVLEVFGEQRLPPNPEWLDFLETLAGQTAIAVDSAHLFEDLQRSHLELALAYDTTLEGWSRALDLRDRETEGHTRRVTEMTLRLARTMGVPDADLVHMRRGSLLHDIGKMAIPDSILFKPGPLTDDEWTIMQRHPVYAYELLAPIAFLQPALDIPYCHHEKWDGSGYPRGLAGLEIPRAARIFAVADVWDALTSDRPYRPAWPARDVRQYIQGLSAIQFDPEVVEAFLKLNDWPAPLHLPPLATPQGATPRRAAAHTTAELLATLRLPLGS